MGINDFYSMEPEAYGNAVADIYEWNTENAGEVDQIIDFLLLQGGDDGYYLDLGCGTGRVAIPLAKRRANVTAVDISRRMLDILGKNDEDDTVHRLESDFAKLPKDLSNFDCIFSVWNSINAVLDPDDQLSLIADLKARLNPGGSLILEMTTPSPRMLSPGPSIARMAPGKVSMQVRRVEFVSQRLISQIVEFDNNETRVVPWVHRYVWPNEIRLMGRVAGFTNISQYSGWTTEPLNEAAGTFVTVLR